MLETDFRQVCVQIMPFVLGAKGLLLCVVCPVFFVCLRIFTSCYRACGGKRGERELLALYFLLMNICVLHPSSVGGCVYERAGLSRLLYSRGTCCRCTRSG